jgi:hypothetical protein
MPSQLIARVRSLEGSLRFLRSPGPWFAIVVAAGALLRLHYVLFTDGTYDMQVWSEFARGIAEDGLMARYRGGDYAFNHPPVMGWIAGKLWWLAEATGTSFRVWFRLPFALLDGATTWALIALLARAQSEVVRRGRWVLGAIYWLCPLSAIFSAQHGNTDTAIAFFLVLSVLQSVRGRAALAGALLGASTWIKLPGILAAPLLCLAQPGPQSRVAFVAGFAAVALAGYLPALLLDGRAVIDAVLLYPGLRVQTTQGMPIWGTLSLLPNIAELPTSLRPFYRDFVRGLLQYNTLICLAPMGLLAWLRRRERSAEGIAYGLACSFALFYGLTNFWGFQYLAWSLPLWLTAGFVTAALAIGSSTVYVAGLYAWLCGSILLLGDWSFVAKPDWPAPIVWSRNAAIVVFLGWGALSLTAAVRAELVRWRGDSRVA